MCEDLLQTGSERPCQRAWLRVKAEGEEPSKIREQEIVGETLSTNLAGGDRLQIGMLSISKERVRSCPAASRLLSFSLIFKPANARSIPVPPLAYMFCVWVETDEGHWLCLQSA